MAKFENEWVEAYFENGVDVANRRVFLDKDIDADSIGFAIKGLYLMETENKETPVEMFISSYGGSLYDALALYDIMNTISCPIHTFAFGKCMSAAPLLLAAGEPGQRWVAPHLSMMHHDMSSSEEGTKSFLEGSMEHMKVLYKQWISLLVKHSNQSFKWWNAKSRLPNDFYYTADEAIEWGLADQVWIEK